MGGLQEGYVQQCLLGGRKKSKDKLAVTLTFLPKEGKVLSAVAWKDTYPLKSFSKVFRFLPDATLNPKP